MTLPLTSHLNGFHLINPPQSPRLSSISRLSVSLPSIWHRTQFQSLVVCARRRKKKVGYQRIAKFLFHSLSLLSPGLQILPQPLDLVIADLGGEDGGGGFWRGWGRFDGWRKKRSRVPILVFVCVILWIYGFYKISVKEIRSDGVLKVLGFCLFGVTMVKKLKRKSRYLVLVFLCLMATLIFGFKKENFVKFASGVRSGSSVLLGKRRFRRRV